MLHKNARVRRLRQVPLQRHAKVVSTAWVTSLWMQAMWVLLCLCVGLWSMQPGAVWAADAAAPPAVASSAASASPAAGASDGRLQAQLARLAQQQKGGSANQSLQAFRTPGQQGQRAASTLPGKKTIPPISSPPSTTMPPASSSTAPPGGAKNSAKVGSSISQDAFAATIRSMMPMTPQEIGTLRLAYDAAQKASAYGGMGVPPEPVASSRSVDLSPGATPPVVRLAAGYITSMVFVDATGAPWPIQSYDLGNPRAYNIQWDKKGNTLMVQAMTQYRPANLAVMLRGLNTPVMVSLVPAQKILDFRVDMRIPGMGPNAKVEMLALPAATDPGLLSVLDGIKPPDAVTLTVTGGRAQAWLRKDELFIRTPLTVISPGWVSMVSSADGTHVYLLPKASMVLATDHGEMVQLRLKGL